jgi:REP element-mobilizing transposase RayT
MSPDSENPGLDRVHHELRAKGVPDGPANPLRSGIHSRGYLPHVKREGAEYFVTFRLADSLPKEVLLRYQDERAQRVRAFQEAKRLGCATGESEEIINRDFLRKVERYLDRGAGACHLRRPEIARLVAGALRFFHEERYLLREWIVMPNHVHVLFWPMPNYLVGEVVKTWKQFTSLRAKRLLRLPEGRFWQPEPFDHWVRNDEERTRIARYIQHNPVTARLCVRPEDWRWSSAWREDSPANARAS